MDVAYSAQGLNADQDIGKSTKEDDTKSSRTMTQLQPDLLAEVRIMHSMDGGYLTREHVANQDSGTSAEEQSAQIPVAEQSSYPPWPLTLKVGDEFSTYEELLEAVRKLEEEQNITYWKRDTRTIEAARNRTMKSFNPAIRYAQIQWSCIKGGRPYNSKSKGRRPKQRTFREGCEAHFRVNATVDGQRLVVTTTNFRHNHGTNKETFQYLPKQRRLNGTELEDVIHILETRPNIKVVHDHIKRKTGKLLKLRDLHNQTNRLSRPSFNLEEALDPITKEGATTRVLHSSNHTLLAVYYQDGQMKEVFKAYPEIIIVDAQYRLNNVRMPVFLQLVVDGNGESHIVSVFVVVNDEKNALPLLLDVFKEENPGWQEIRTVLIEKDFSERLIYTRSFPGVQMHLSLFHVFRAMRRDMSVGKMGITKEQKLLCLELMQKMAYANCEQTYKMYYEQLKLTKIYTVVEYYTSNWHNIKEEWVMALKSSPHFTIQTMGRIERINQKIRQVVRRFSDFKLFFQDLQLSVQMLRQERDAILSDVIMKKPSQAFPEDSPEAIFAQELTPFALETVVKQIELSRVIEIAVPSPQLQIQTSTGLAFVTANSCSCGFWEANLLPCRHIFALRARLGLNLYFPEGISQRWSLRHYQGRKRCSFAFPGDKRNQVCDTPTAAVFSQGQKYRAAFTVAQRLATLSSECSVHTYQSRMRVLRKLQMLWEAGLDATVLDFPQENSLQEDDFTILEKNPRKQSALFPQCDVCRRDKTGDRSGLSCQHVPSDQSRQGLTYKNCHTLFTLCNTEGESIQSSRNETKLYQRTDNDHMTNTGVEMIDCSGKKLKNETVGGRKSIICKTEDPLKLDMISQSAIKTENMEDCVFVKEEF